ncbi:MAG: winged helix-turn-helix domain-containing protein [Rubrivivax sp.]|nr:winged helix-turn-helix domain-containing protein [Rubrivivax sp.]
MQRSLRCEGQPVHLGSRAFDLLVALCRRPGQVVSNRELLAAAWPNRVVDEGSVRVHIASLRKTLGDGIGERRYISNVPMRGYCLVVPVETVSEAAASSPADEGPDAPPAERRVAPAAGPSWRLPAGAGLVGRDREAALLLQDLHQHPCVTLVGAGGIGKTSVALPVARRFAETQGAELVLVELAALSKGSKGEGVPMAIASALGVVVTDQQPLPAITRQLVATRRVLLVLDNCEHVIDGVAIAAEHILSQTTGLHILATSRESLRIQGEWVRRLEPLPVPPLASPGSRCSLEEARGYASVRLFLDRAGAAAGGFELADDEVSLLCQLCRRLDGIPLAIELAAGAVDAVGLRGLVERLGSRLGSRLVLVGRGRRTALPRHQTLRATLDWSHSLLPEAEQALLARLSIFRGVFTHAAALAVFDRPPEVLDEGLAGLVAKSLVVSEKSGSERVYRLLETTREYAAERLVASGELDAVALLHANFLLQLLRAAQPGREETPAAQRGVSTLRWIDDLREAVSWATGSDHTRGLSVSLVAGSAPLWFAHSLLAEYRLLAEAALATLTASPPASPPASVNAEDEMRLSEALGHALWHTHGGGAAMNAAFHRGLVLAERLQATAYRLRCRWGLWLVCNAEGDHAGSLRLAEQFGDIAAASDDAGVHLAHERMMALGCHFQGDQAQARRYAQRVLQGVPTRAAVAPRGDAQFDPRVAGLTVMARVLWLQGLPWQALRHAEEAVNEALAIDHGLSLCFAIAIGAAPVAFWCGGHERARAWSGLLKQRADERAFHYWQAFGDGYQRVLGLQPGDALPALALVGLAPVVPLRETLSTFHPGFLDDDLAARAEQGIAGWCAPELLRLVGERQRRSQAPALAAATFRRGLALARQQHALAWELRCATSLAQMSLDQTSLARGRRAEAHASLHAVLAQFTEGHDTQDLRRAGAVLEQLARP